MDNYEMMDYGIGLNKLAEEVSDMKHMFKIMLEKFDGININNSISIDKKNKIINNNYSTLNIETLIKNKTNVSITLTDYLFDLDINKDDLELIFNSKTYDDGFIKILNKYINLENVNEFPLRAFEDKRGKTFYAYDEKNVVSDDDVNDMSNLPSNENINNKYWFIISSPLLATKLRIIHKKIISQLCIWQNSNLDLLKTNDVFQDKYRKQISKLTCGTIDKLIRSNSPFRNQLFELLRLN